MTRTVLLSMLWGSLVSLLGLFVGFNVGRLYEAARQHRRALGYLAAMQWEVAGRGTAKPGRSDTPPDMIGGARGGGDNA